MPNNAVNPNINDVHIPEGLEYLCSFVNWNYSLWAERKHFGSISGTERAICLAFRFRLPVARLASLPHISLGMLNSSAPIWTDSCSTRNKALQQCTFPCACLVWHVRDILGPLVAAGPEDQAEPRKISQWICSRGHASWVLVKLLIVLSLLCLQTQALQTNKHYMQNLWYVHVYALICNTCRNMQCGQNIDSSNMSCLLQKYAKIC